MPHSKLVLAAAVLLHAQSMRYLHWKSMVLYVDIKWRLIDYYGATHLVALIIRDMEGTRWPVLDL